MSPAGWAGRVHMVPRPSLIDVSPFQKRNGKSKLLKISLSGARIILALINTRLRMAPPIRGAQPPGSLAVAAITTSLFTVALHTAPGTIWIIATSTWASAPPFHALEPFNPEISYLFTAAL